MATKKTTDTLGKPTDAIKKPDADLTKKKPDANMTKQPDGDPMGEHMQINRATC